MIPLPHLPTIMFNIKFFVSYRNYGPKGESVQILGAVVVCLWLIIVHFIVDTERPSGTNHWKRGEKHEL